jgi:hypothetical protein
MGDDLRRETMALLWLPPSMQEVSNLMCPVIECVLLSGLFITAFEKPLASMVICGPGPNLVGELSARSATLVFPIQIFSIIAPIQVVDFLHPFYRRQLTQ